CSGTGPQLLAGDVFRWWTVKARRPVTSNGVCPTAERHVAVPARMRDVPVHGTFPVRRGPGSATLR
ncbi:MAG: hypothetical protein L0H93_13775, partial [Nocardioides sp.]|nr:hypothetical protein [Nocardioides sp.]